MITVNNITLQFGKKPLFKDVSLKFTPGNCYGIIGANGAGKSTFLKILSGVIEPQKGDVQIDSKMRMAVLEQDQFKFDDEKVLDTVIMGHKELYELSKVRDELYSKTEFTEEEGMKMGEVEAEFAEMNGYEAEAEAGMLLSGLGLPEESHELKMGELEAGDKIKVLLAQALFGNPDILLLDEPTNNLDINAKNWLEDFLINFNNTVLVVSHDRHFLNTVCTHITDIDFGQINMFAGNYEFWLRASQLSMKQKKDQNKKSEDKIKELKEFISRFSANASKAKQATARKKMIDKLTIDNIPHTSRRFPYIEFKAEREVGNIVLNINNISKEVDGELLINDFSLQVNPKDKIAFVGKNDLAKTVLFDILMGEMEQDNGTIEWGQTITPSYFPKENSKYFQTDLPITDWLRQYSDDNDETYIRSFLGRMLFSGEDALKPVNVLSGGEKVRCMLSKMMMESANVLVADEPTNHLDLESISALNDGLIKYDQVLLFSSHDHQLMQSTANRIVEIGPNGFIDKMTTYDEYMSDEEIKERRKEIYEESVKED
ncbi:MAG: ABC-F family ATP-binding cassette domain-containing protein [Chlorobiota bacterium]